MGARPRESAVVRVNGVGSYELDDVVCVIVVVVTEEETELEVGSDEPSSTSGSFGSWDESKSACDAFSVARAFASFKSLRWFFVSPVLDTGTPR